MSASLKADLAELRRVNEAIATAEARGERAKVEQLRKRLGPLLARIRQASNKDAMA